MIGLTRDELTAVRLLVNELRQVPEHDADQGGAPRRLPRREAAVDAPPFWKGASAVSLAPRFRP